MSDVTRTEYQRLNTELQELRTFKAGEIVGITGDKIIIRIDDRDHTYTVTPSASVFIKGVSARLADLKPSMHVHFVTSLADDERIISIEHVDHSKEEHRPPPK